MNADISPHDFPVLVIAYDDLSRAVIADNLASLGEKAVHCSTFCEARDHAYQGLYRGILVDLMAMLKASAEESIVAYTLTDYYPTLRVRTLGTMIVPMAMSGDPKQDKSLDDFLTKACAEFEPRRLRASKRIDVRIPTRIETNHGFALNISMDGVFIADIDSNRFPVGEDITVTFPDFGLDVKCLVARAQTSGQRRPQGIGVQFRHVSRELVSNLLPLLNKVTDPTHDRLVGMY